MGGLIALGGQALNWFITPMSHPNAGPMQTAAVAVQAVAAFGAAVWLTRRARRGARAAG